MLSFCLEEIKCVVMSMNNTNLVELFGAVFSVNILTHSNKGFKLSMSKFVYCTFLTSLFVISFYFGSKSLLPSRDDFSMKHFSLWIMLSMQLFSPVLTLTVELLTFNNSALGANYFVKVHKLVSTLGYQKPFLFTKQYNTKTQIFVLTFAVVMNLYLLFMLYPYDTVHIKNSPLLIQVMVCVVFDVIIQINHTNVLQTMMLYSIFLRKTIKSPRLWSLDKNAKVEKLRTLRIAHSLLSKTLILFNFKYYAPLLFTSIKTTVSVASIVSDFVVDKIFLSFVLFESDDRRTIENSSYFDLVWSAYYIIFLLFTFHTHSSITYKVNSMASVIHTILTTGKVDDVADELFDFSMEILQTEFHFNAFGFFKVDYTLMFRVLSGIVSYMVILVQFQFQTKTTLFESSSASLSSLLLAYADSTK